MTNLGGPTNDRDGTGQELRIKVPSVSTVRRLQVHVAVLWLLLLLGAFDQRGLWRHFVDSDDGGSSWHGPMLALRSDQDPGQGYYFCTIGAPKEASRIGRYGDRAAFERLVLETEMGEPIVALYRDAATREGRIAVYNRQGEVIWQAP
jgi:hypothetical protein